MQQTGRLGGGLLQGLVVLVVALWLSAPVLMAQAPAQGQFELVKPGEIQEKLPATPFVFVAYAFVWVALAFYVFLMWRRLARVERDLADVRGKLQRSQ